MSIETYMQSMDALGTHVELRVVALSVKDAEESLSQLWEEIIQFENTFSRFLSDSELSRFNTRAGEKVHISDMFKDILECVKHFGKITEGLFNPFILPRLQRAGYQNSMTVGTSIAPDYSARDVVSYTALEIGSDWARIPKNTAVDLGGIGKGFLADFLGTCVKKPIERYCFSLGGDILLNGKDELGNFWSIDIQSNTDREKSIARYVAQTAGKLGVATSGSVREKLGKKQKHQIHPNGLDFSIQTEFDICSVVANDAVTADVMASMILLGGVDFAERMMQNGTIQAVLLQRKNKQTPILIGQGFTLI